MHDRVGPIVSSLPAEKLAYFEWRESLNGYEDYDSHIDDDQRLRRKLRITAADEIEWRQLRESECRVEF